MPDITYPIRAGGRFRGPAYNYLRKTDRLPTVDEIAPEPDPVCRVKLFAPEGRYTYFVAALTAYGPELVLTGWCVSWLDSSYDEWGDTALSDVLAVRTPRFGLPLERDLGFQPDRVSAIVREHSPSKTWGVAAGA